MKQQSRRTFLGSLASLAGATCLSGTALARSATLKTEGLHVACNEYAWFTFFQREGKVWHSDRDAALAEYIQSGLKGFEPSFLSVQQVEELKPLLDKYGLEMRSLYVNSRLHDPADADRSIEEALAIAETAKQAGTRIIVTNPSPLVWGGQEDKDDAQLEVQAANLDRLGAALRQMGMILAYHNHDMELRQAAREFHHMMLATDPANVSLCLDAHWVYRGSGNSQVALFDVVRLYGNRITEVHLRQSQNGIWSEVFGPGDIDYPRLATELKRAGVKPLLVLEQSIEEGSPNTMTGVEAHRKSLEYTLEVFSGSDA